MSGRAAIAGLALVGGVVAIPARAQAPASPPTCQQVAPATIATARMPDAVWEAMPGWTARIRFRIDPADGSPMDVESTLMPPVRPGDGPVDEALLTRIAADALARYRFCTPSVSDPWLRYSVALRFDPVRKWNAYVQGFEPFYARADIRANRAGRAEAKLVFDVTGVPRHVEIVTSSGDAALDRKVAATVANDRLVIADDKPLAKPVTFVQAFTFQTR